MDTHVDITKFRIGIQMSSAVIVLRFFWILREETIRKEGIKRIAFILVRYY